MRWTKKRIEVGSGRKVKRFAWFPVVDEYGKGVWLEYYIAHETYCLGYDNYGWGLWMIEYID